MREKFRVYLNHFLPREVVGPVIIVFSLEGVISGIFDLYVPQEYATLAWGFIFLMSIWVVAKWGTSGEAESRLEHKIDELEAN
jgi:hypothetical protein